MHDATGSAEDLPPQIIFYYNEGKECLQGERWQDNQDEPDEAPSYQYIFSSWNPFEDNADAQALALRVFEDGNLRADMSSRFLTDKVTTHGALWTGLLMTPETFTLGLCAALNIRLAE